MKHTVELEGLRCSARSEYYMIDHAPSREGYFSWWKCTIVSFWIFFSIFGRFFGGFFIRRKKTHEANHN